MAAPVVGEANLPDVQTSDIHLINNGDRRPFDLADDDFTISQLAKCKNYLPQPPPPTSLTPSRGKRMKSRPVRYGVSAPVAEKKRPSQKLCNVVHDHSSICLSSPKENSATKCVKSPVEDSAAVIRAKEIQSSLGIEHPSCIRVMSSAHVGGGYWMGFPQPFSKLYLPKKDTEMEIEDENGGICCIRYIADKGGLSAGWKRFSDEHSVLEGDVLVFHLIQPCKIKVYIIRANDLNKVDGTSHHLNLEAHTEQMNPENQIETDTLSLTTKKSKLPNSLRVHKKRKAMLPSNTIVEGSGQSNADLFCQEFKSFEDFHIMVKGICIDSELPDDVRMNYYTLCMSRKEFLHDALPKTLYHKLVAGMIGETVNIATEIKKCNLTTPIVEFQIWDQSLESFALLGMKVGFLRDRIQSLVNSEGQSDILRYAEAKNEHKRIKEDIKHTKEKLEELNTKSREFQDILDDLKHKTERHEVKFQEKVDAPW